MRVKIGADRFANPCPVAFASHYRKTLSLAGATMLASKNVTPEDNHRNAWNACALDLDSKRLKSKSWNQARICVEKCAAPETGSAPRT